MALISISKGLTSTMTQDRVKVDQKNIYSASNLSLGFDIVLCSHVWYLAARFYKWLIIARRDSVARTSCSNPICKYFDFISTSYKPPIVFWHWRLMMVVVVSRVLRLNVSKSAKFEWIMRIEFFESVIDSCHLALSRSMVLFELI